MNTLFVRKKDGSIEVFDKSKISKITKAAGLSRFQAEMLSDDIENWVYSTKKGVSTYQIRNRVVSLLKKINMHAANVYEWYGLIKKLHA